MINKYNKTFNKKVYSLPSENVRQNLCDLPYISFPQFFVSMSAKHFQLKAVKAMEILIGEQMRGLRKM